MGDDVVEIQPDGQAIWVFSTWIEFCRFWAASQPFGVLHHGTCTKRGGHLHFPPRDRKRQQGCDAHTSLWMAPMTNEWGEPSMLNFDLAKFAFTSRATLIRGLLDGRFNGEVCIDWSARERMDHRRPNLMLDEVLENEIRAADPGIQTA